MKNLRETKSLIKDMRGEEERIKRNFEEKRATKFSRKINFVIKQSPFKQVF